MFSKLYVSPEDRKKDEQRKFMTTLLSVSPEASPVRHLQFTEASSPSCEKHQRSADCDFKLSAPEHTESSTKSKRRPPSSQSSLKAKYVDFRYVLDLVCGDTKHGYKGTDCTCKGCKAFFKENPKNLDVIREGLYGNWGPCATRADRKANLFQDLYVGYTFDEEKKVFTHRWFIAGQQVCYSFYLAARGYTHKYVHKYKKVFKTHEARLQTLMETIYSDGNSYRSTTAPKKENFLAWLDNFAKSVGDYMPNEEALVLPYAKFEGVFGEYKMEMLNRKELPCHYSYACRIFSEEVSNIRLVRNKGSFVCCKVCTSYQTRILKARSFSEREDLKKKRLEHVEKQRQERIHYYTHREAALSSPDHILSIILDGMDQSKTNVPLLSRKTSDRVVGMRLVGVKVHGIGEYVFLVDTTVKGGANLMTEVLRLTLLDLEQRNKLPTINPILYLQLDNCKENKNRVLFGFLAHLVDRGVFEQVQVGFLMVGHTHEDIDQFFSVISSWLKKWETICADIEQLKQEIENAFLSKKRSPPEIFQLSAVAIHNYDNFYLPHINKKLAYHTVPHQYKFQKFDGSVLCHYKMWSTHASWLPCAQPTPADTRNVICDHNETESVMNLTASKELQTNLKRKRTHVRGASKPNLKKRRIVSDDTEDSDAERTNNHPIYDTEFSEEIIPTQGIKWLTSCPHASSAPNLVVIPAEEMAKNLAQSQAMFEHVTKIAPFNDAVFTAQSLVNWKSWIILEEKIWSDTEAFVATLPPFQWPQPWAARIPRSPPSQIAQPAEKPDFAAGSEIIVHESGAHGSFSKQDRKADQRKNILDQSILLSTEVVTGKGCLYKWVDDENPEEGEYLWLGIVVSIVEGAATSEDCKMLVRWCPNNKKHLWKTKISENDTFDLSYTTRLKKPPYRDVIQKSSCLALNLTLTTSGKLDNKYRMDDGSTSKEVVKSVIEEFYAYA